MTAESYILLGPPGSGKSTLAECMVKNLDLVHIDIGGELRKAAEGDTPFAQEINDTINAKKEFVSDLVVYGVLAQALMRIPQGQGIVLDGAPRRESQIDEVLHVVNVSGRDIKALLFIHLPEELSIERISKRFKCGVCREPLILGESIHSAVERCPKCGGEVEQRADDTREGVRKRYRTFQELTVPVVEQFRKKKLLIEVDGLQTAENTCATIVKQLKSLT